LARLVVSCLVRVPAGERAWRCVGRRAVRLICAGWVPHDRVFVGSVPRL
jgi:hypothetical protein